MTTHDRVAHARSRHLRSKGGKKSKHPRDRCEECGMQWPCTVQVLLGELDRARRELEVTRAKPPVPAPLKRPSLPPRRAAGGRSWTVKRLLVHARWMRRQAERFEELAGVALARAIDDVDEALESAPIEGGGSPRYEEDGSRTGRTPGQALQHERIRPVVGIGGAPLRDPATGEPVTVATWVHDPVLAAGSRMMAAVEAVGDHLADAVAAGTMLAGLSQADAKRLVTPQPGRCENEHCRRWVDNTPVDRLIVFSGDGLLRCSACDQHRRRTGSERVPSPDVELRSA